MIPSLRRQPASYSREQGGPRPVITHLPEASLVVGTADLVLAVWLHAQLDDLSSTHGESIAALHGGDPARSDTEAGVDGSPTADPALAAAARV